MDVECKLCEYIWYYLHRYFYTLPAGGVANPGQNFIISINPIARAKSHSCHYLAPDNNSPSSLKLFSSCFVVSVRRFCHNLIPVMRNDYSFVKAYVVNVADALPRLHGIPLLDGIMLLPLLLLFLPSDTLFGLWNSFSFNQCFLKLKWQNSSPKFQIGFRLWWSNTW